MINNHFSNITTYLIGRIIPVPAYLPPSLLYEKKVSYSLLGPSNRIPVEGNSTSGLNYNSIYSTTLRKFIYPERFYFINPNSPITETFVNTINQNLVPGTTLSPSTVYSEIREIVRFFNKNMADPFSDYQTWENGGYLTRRPNTPVTHDEINAYSRMSYINTFLSFYIFYYRYTGVSSNFDRTKIKTFQNQNSVQRQNQDFFQKYYV
jgi:hypothetical protein